MSKYFFTSESVTEGHPDKVCDLISDSILDEYLKIDENARVAVETFASGNMIHVAGQITAKGQVDIEKIVRNVLKQIGFDNSNTDMDYRTCKILVDITKQSPDIALGVDVGGAGDQGIMFGYACKETENYMPYAIDMAHKLAKQLSKVRKEGILTYLRPDGKTQVTVEYEDDKPKRIDTILISTQHLDNIDIETLRKDVREKVINVIVPEDKIDNDTKIYINPTGRFVIGGPLGDTGLTGRKIIVDTYGGYAKHGGGAFSGKDATKVDRSACYMLRYVAKNIVANNLADKCELQISYAIGKEMPTSVYINTFGTAKIPETEILEIIKNKFDFTPKGVISYLQLTQPMFSNVTNYGHFGKQEFTWEKIIKF